MPDSPRTDHLSTAAIAAGSVEDARALLGVAGRICPNCRAGDGEGECLCAEADPDDFLPGPGGEYGGGSM